VITIVSHAEVRTKKAKASQAAIPSVERRTWFRKDKKPQLRQCSPKSPVPRILTGNQIEQACHRLTH
jgi:hypothetical protein